MANALKAQAVFVPNVGQWNHAAVAVAQQAYSTFFVDKSGFRLRMLNPTDCLLKHTVWHTKQAKQYTVHGHNLIFNWLQANSTTAQFKQASSYYYNYFIGSPNRWRSKVYSYTQVSQAQLYEFTDIVYYQQNNSIEWDIILHPNANVENIKCQVQGAEYLQIKEGNLEIYNSVQPFYLKKPFAYQDINGLKVPITCRFTLQGSVFGFELGNYNPNYDVTIDPILVFSTYSGSKGDNFGFTATYDSKGNLYAGGIVDTAQGQYPVTAGSFQTTYGGNTKNRAPVNLDCDISISKYDPTGANLLWASYYGGIEDEYPHSLVCDNNDNLFLFGTTWSSDFPTTANAYSRIHKGFSDIIVGKISADGTTLIASTLLGGNATDGLTNGALSHNYADEFRGDIIANDVGDVYIATTTNSATFPVSNWAPQKIKGLSNDAVLIKLSSDLSKIIFSTFLGGDDNDAAYSVKLQNNKVYIGGGTSSNDIVWPSNALNPNYLGGNCDGFIAEYTGDSGYIISGTYLGSSSYDQVYFLETDLDNRIYATGQTNGTMARTQGTFGKNNSKQFITCIKNTLDSTYWQCTFGNSTLEPELVPSAFMVDNCYNIYFSGWGSTANLTTTSNAYQKTTDNEDFYLLVLDKNAQNLVYATYFGGNKSLDHVDGGTSRFDKSGVVYQSVCSSCPNAPPGLQDFPVTPGAAFTSNASYRCSNASFKFDFEITYSLNANFTYSPIQLCTNDTVIFTNLSKQGATYLWDFGDGHTSTSYHTKHHYKTEGTYTVTLTVTDPLSCNINASKSTTVMVQSSPSGNISASHQLCSKEYTFELSNGIYDPNYQWLINGQKASTKQKFNSLLDVGNNKILLVIKHPTNNCFDSLTLNINTFNDSSGSLLLSNIFTPNDDGKNDCFSPQGITQTCDKIKFDIYNRWGEHLFSTTQIGDCWNGNVSNGKVQAPDGVYFYILEIEQSSNLGKKEKITGSVTLIR